MGADAPKPPGAMDDVPMNERHLVAGSGTGYDIVLIKYNVT